VERVAEFTQTMVRVQTPQGLKLSALLALGGTAEAVPFPSVLPKF
jgi:hypothetical protein